MRIFSGKTGERIEFETNIPLYFPHREAMENSVREKLVFLLAERDNTNIEEINANYNIIILECRVFEAVVSVVKHARHLRGGAKGDRVFANFENFWVLNNGISDFNKFKIDINFNNRTKVLLSLTLCAIWLHRILYH